MVWGFRLRMWGKWYGLSGSRVFGFWGSGAVAVAGLPFLVLATSETNYYMPAPQCAGNQCDFTAPVRHARMLT